MDTRSAEYEIRITRDFAGDPVVLEEFPELEILYESAENRLCSSNYRPEIKCVSEGYLSLVLRVNGKRVTINDHDKRFGKWSVIVIEEREYLFQGIQPIVLNKSREETYIVFAVESRPSSRRR